MRTIEQAMPLPFAQADRDPRDVGVLTEEVVGNRRGERFDRVQRIVFGKYVNRIATGVGGDHQRVVAGGVGGVERSLQFNIDRDLDQLVAFFTWRGKARAFDLAEPNAMFPICLLNQSDAHLAKICSLAGRAV